MRSATRPVRRVPSLSKTASAAPNAAASWKLKHGLAAILKRFALSRSGAADMAAPTPGDMGTCDPKCACNGGPHAGQAFLCDAPCAGQGEGCTFDCSVGCDCIPSGSGECYGAQVTSFTCDNPPVRSCFRSAPLRCEEELGGCPVVSTIINNYRECDEPSGPATFAVVYQYPDGSFAQVGAGSGANVRYLSATVQPVIRVTCGAAPC